MAISLTTGLPGHGKTLRTIFEVEQRRISEGRRIYQYGIPDLTLDWFELEDPEKWFELPEGSIIVIDEAQKIFPVRPSGSRVPVHVSEFETHRHRGLDIVLITQHPNLIDAHVRKLVERHQHVMRPFGHSYAVIFEWQVCTDPQRSGVQKQALKTRWRYPKEVFKNYKSASLHTVKSRLPGRVLLLPILGAVIGLLLYIARGALHQDALEDNALASSASAEGVNSVTPAGVMPQRQYRQPEPFEGWQFYVAGDLNGELLISADIQGRSLALTQSELASAGYYVTPLSSCIVRIGYRESIYYAKCRPSGLIEHKQDQQRPVSSEQPNKPSLQDFIKAATSASG
jgi:zona occludens toxin (predicted ATPase)